MRALVELLASETNNSAFHGTRLDVEHIAQVMEALLTSAERRFGLHRLQIAPELVFMSHETFTPARGGSASAEVVALRRNFGEAASEVVVANTKGFTGHPMGVGIEDVIAVKILEYGRVPPVPNYKEVDPELGTAAAFSARLRDEGVLMNATGPQRLRAVTHLDVSRKRVQQAAAILQDAAAAVGSIAN